MNVRSSPSTSEPTMVIVAGVSSSVVTIISAATGASFTGVTVKVNVSVFESSVPSFAVTLIVAEPLKLSDGVIMRFASKPSREFPSR